jgi:hypothetical protein
MKPRAPLGSVCGLLVLFACCACQHGAGGDSQLKMPAWQLPLPGAQGVAFKLPPSNLRPLDVNRLDFADFIPPGAQRIGPSNPLPTDLAPANRTKFPSTDLAYSPDRSCVLFHDGSQRTSLIIHWLMMLRKGLPSPHGVFGTTTAFETSWAGDSQRFSVTNFTGDNSSEVFVEDVAELRRINIAVRPLIEEYFPLHVMSAPMFVKAYRWTSDGKLVVRAIGRAEAEPYDEFGCEALVSFPGPAAEPQTEYLHGYILPQPAQ